MLIVPAMAVWQVDTVGPASVIENPVLAYNADGVPHIAYYNLGADSIMHVWRPGTTWIQETVGKSAGTHAVSLTFDPKGNPCISYSDGIIVGNLKFAKRTSFGWVTSTVTKGAWGPVLGNAGHYSSLAFDSQGVPHIAYIDGSTYACLYYASLNATTATWKTDKIFAGESKRTATGFETVLRFNEKDWPFIAFIDNYKDKARLMYTFSTDGGATWQTPVYLDYGTDSVERTQWGASLAIDSSGAPHFSYFGKIVQSPEYSNLWSCPCSVDRDVGIYYVYWDNDKGWIKETIPKMPPGLCDSLITPTTSIALDANNKPHITYSTVSGDIIHATRTAPNVWIQHIVAPAQIVDFKNDMKKYYSSPTIAINAQGQPAITYVDSLGVTVVDPYGGRYIEHSDRLGFAQWIPEL